MPNGNEIEHPSHYTSGEVECIDGIRAALGDEGFEAYCAGNVIKYAWRYRHKGGLTDIRKACEYLGWLAEDLELDERAEAEGEQEACEARRGGGRFAATRETAAAWVEAHGGLEEVDRRLMPAGMEWPRYEDGERLTAHNAPEDVFAVCIGLNGKLYALLDNIPIFADGCLVLADSGERMERPEPDVKGAVGAPTKVGETACDAGLGI